ncbi:hypothetical protein BCR43DRAFT_492953 [Syncephalastrum racemosum]|uniref:Uncharacterized protein n=1 Tax=Syncephalastrum racemosum TaxID=13706 RepID=A0A1X2HB28_SYNRA|nr:hypothetical protein BCR43DRAFT_492953 [Syncephalastrum racemosum]
MTTFWKSPHVQPPDAPYGHEQARQIAQEQMERLLAYQLCDLNREYLLESSVIDDELLISRPVLEEKDPCTLLGELVYMENRSPPRKQPSETVNQNTQKQLVHRLMDSFFAKLLMKCDQQVDDLLMAQTHSLLELSDMKKRGNKRPHSEASLPPQQTAAPKRPVTAPGRSRDPRTNAPTVKQVQPVPPQSLPQPHVSSLLRPQQPVATPIAPPISRKGKGRAGSIAGAPPVVESATASSSPAPRPGKLTLIDHGATVQVRKDTDGTKVICRKANGTTIVLGTPQEFDDAFWYPANIRIKYVAGEKYYYSDSLGFIGRFSQIEPLIRKFFLTNTPANY